MKALEEVIVEERPLVRKFSRTFSRSSEVLLHPKDLEQEGLVFLCKLYQKLDERGLDLEEEDMKHLMCRSLKNFYIGLMRKYSRKKRTAQTVGLDFVLPGSGDVLGSSIFCEHLDRLKKSFQQTERQVFDILTGRDGHFSAHLKTESDADAVKVRRVDMANWLNLSPFCIGEAVSTMKEKVASEFGWESVNKVKRKAVMEIERIPKVKSRQIPSSENSTVQEKRLLWAFANELYLFVKPNISMEELGLKILNLGQLAYKPFLSNRLRQFLHYQGGKRMFDVKEEDDCFGKAYDPAAEECEKCEQWQECKELMEETEMATKKQRKERMKKKQYAAQPKDKKEEKAVVEEEEVKEPSEKVEKSSAEKAVAKSQTEKLINPYKPGSGAGYAFDVLMKGGTKNELIERLEKIVKQEELKIDPKKRMNRILADIRKGIDEKLKPYQLIEEGEGGWKTYQVIKREQAPE